MLVLYTLLCFCSLLKIIDSNPRFPRTLTEDGECDAGWRCARLSDCDLALRDFETIFPCSAYGASIKVCCPPDTELSLSLESSTKSKAPPDSTSKGPLPRTETTTSKPPVTTKASTTKSSSTTRKPPTLPERLNFTQLWSVIPESLQNKVALLPEECGEIVVADRITRGEDAELGGYPWMALIGYEDNGVKKFYCGGTLINKRYILTAAHCSKVANFTPTFVRLGEWDLTKEQDCVQVSNKMMDCADPVVDVPIEEFIKHEYYGNRSLPLLRFDIALIRLAVEVNFTDFIKPICLSPRLHRIRNETYSVSGWGVTDNALRQNSPILQYVYVTLYNFDECSSIAPAEVSPLLRNTQFCAGGLNGQDACKGDSGGPLSYNLYNKEYQKGIVSLATSVVCGAEGRPTVYTEITGFIKWILKKIEP